MRPPRRPRPRLPLTLRNTWNHDSSWNPARSRHGVSESRSTSAAAGAAQLTLQVVIPPAWIKICVEWAWLVIGLNLGRQALQANGAYRLPLGPEPLSRGMCRNPAPLPAPRRRLHRGSSCRLAAWAVRAERLGWPNPSPTSPARPTTRSRRRHVEIWLRSARVPWLPVGGPGVVHPICIMTKMISIST